ncbi:hypothetical protein F5Y15DRAFT_166527 [Xylariaceae sp. FL0016]|nr:hypothetical protein F5Y15DRAFT_166527 [Xylariaceae sp. FL0016]
MPAQTRSGGKPPSTTTNNSKSCKPSSAPLKQQEFPHRRQHVKKTKTYGKFTRRFQQGTLTQMDFTSSAVQLAMHELEDEDEDEEEDEIEEPVVTAKPQQKRRGNRRKTTGDELDREEKPRKSKRRKTIGDTPNPSASSSFHTQTLTQMIPPNADSNDIWQSQDSDVGDDDDLGLPMATPKGAKAKHVSYDDKENVISSVPHLTKSVTPSNRQKRTEIPASDSPTTPMLLRYSPAPHQSPLIAKSTNVTAPSPILKKGRCDRIPLSRVIPDSYSTTHTSPTTPTPKSAVKATPSKRLRFEIPEDKENITPGRTKPKSPKPMTRPSARRRPLQEVPDSDEDLGETEDETEDEEAGLRESTPTPSQPKSTMYLETEQETGFGPELGHESEHESEQEQEPDLPETCYDDIGEETQAEIISEEKSSRVPFPSHEDEEVELDLIAESVVDQDITDENDVSSHSHNQAMYTQTQGFESQRLPLDVISSLGPQGPRSDIMVSLHPEHVTKILDGTKNHEFRAWKIPTEVSRVWIYITKPDCELRYMCQFGPPRVPGEIPVDDDGAGNQDFNQRKLAMKFAYEILQVYELNNPVALSQMKSRGWVAGPPQKYCLVPPAVVGELTANLRCALFRVDQTPVSSPPQAPVADDGDNNDIPSHSSKLVARSPEPEITITSSGFSVTESQELKNQLQSDADHSTQHHSNEHPDVTVDDDDDEIIPQSPSPRLRRSQRRQSTTSTRRDPTFPKPALAAASSSSSSRTHAGGPGLVRPSQATTVSQASSPPAFVSPERSSITSRRNDYRQQQQRNQNIIIGSSPTTRRRAQSSSFKSSQFPTRSQLLPDSLIHADIQEPPPVIWDSADEDIE